MCGRYAMSFRPSMARRRLQDENMPVDDAPDDDDDRIRQSYNFAPGYHGLVYRAEVPDHGAHDEQQQDGEKDPSAAVDGASTRETKYKLQAMKWGLIPFWTKRAPDYGSQLKTINCRDDSLAQAGGMWNTMKQKKRCIIIAEGFYEWLKKNNGREKIPHFVKRKDGQLMCFAGLWDCVKYEGQAEKLYTYTIITTDSNKQLNFLHDRMPVILDNGSDAMNTWLDPCRHQWSKELQSLLKPYSADLECYPVDRAVGKVGNNSPTFVVPIDSKENKKNIANFFNNQKTPKKEPTEDRDTDPSLESTEDNAPLPKPEHEPVEARIKPEFLHDQTPADIDASPTKDISRAVKRHAPDDQDSPDINNPPNKAQKLDPHDQDGEKPHLKSPERKPSRTTKTRSAVSNNSAAKPPSKSLAADGSRKITSFFAK